MKTALLIVMVFLGACKASQFQNGTYRVAYAKKISNNQSIVHLEGLNKEFVMPTDTLKKGDYVYFADKRPK